jgi:hypothetical protein
MERSEQLIEDISVDTRRGGKCCLIKIKSQKERVRRRIGRQVEWLKGLL